MNSEPRILTEREALILQYFGRYEAYVKRFASFLNDVMRRFLPHLPEEERHACDVISTHCTMPDFDEWIGNECFHEKLEWDKHMGDMADGEPEEVRRRFAEMMQNYKERRDNGEVECLFSEDESLAVQAFALLEGRRILVEFPYNEFRLFSMEPLLEQPEYAPLKDESAFQTAVVDVETGAITWCDGTIVLQLEVIEEQGERINWRQ